MPPGSAAQAMRSKNYLAFNSIDSSGGGALVNQVHKKMASTGLDSLLDSKDSLVVASKDIEEDFSLLQDRKAGVKSPILEKFGNIYSRQNKLSLSINGAIRSRYGGN